QPSALYGPCLAFAKSVRRLLLRRSLQKLQRLIRRLCTLPEHPVRARLGQEVVRRHHLPTGEYPRRPYQPSPMPSSTAPVCLVHRHIRPRLAQSTGVSFLSSTTRFADSTTLRRGSTSSRSSSPSGTPAVVQDRCRSAIPPRSRSSLRSCTWSSSLE